MDHENDGYCSTTNDAFVVQVFQVAEDFRMNAYELQAELMRCLEILDLIPEDLWRDRRG